jgi:hypothetical protein
MGPNRERKGVWRREVTWFEEGELTYFVLAVGDAVHSGLIYQLTFFAVK